MSGDKKQADLTKQKREQSQAMIIEKLTAEQVQARDRENYQITSLADEIRADQLCALLLKQFHLALLEKIKLDPLEAGSLAAGADYFLRDYLISNQLANIFDATAETVRRFAASWYILNNLEPNLTELRSLLKGVEAFYNYCAENDLIDRVQAAEIATACYDFAYYQERIESFFAITGDGYRTWEEDGP